MTIFDEFRTWTFDKALPFWADKGPDRRFGGFVEALTFSGHDAEKAFKRTRVTCRQMYVFSHASTMGWRAGDDLIAHGADYLVSKVWRGEEYGFARTMTRSGEVEDPTPDLYDHAFALFAFAWAYKATSDSNYRDWAHKTLDWIERNMRHDSGAGFWHETPPRGWRLQNPHMHLLEACLAAYSATGHARFKERALEVAALFETRFLNRETGVLSEYFDDDWSVADDPKGRIVEPGHQLEWAWILDQCRTVFGLEAQNEIRRLAAFAETHGVDPATGAVMNVIRDDGAVIDAGSRTWPNTERLKAAVALYRLDETNPMTVLDSCGRLLLDRYLCSSSDIQIPDGAWIDAFDGAGTAIAKNIPASTFYHVFLAFAEVLAIHDKVLASHEH